MTDPCLLIGDIGGTNARFALAHTNEPRFSAELTLSCADYATVQHGITAYLERCGVERVDVICLAAAGPIVDGSIDVTNNHWEIDSSALELAFGPCRAGLLNDFEAIAYSIPLLSDTDIQTIGLVSSELAGRTEFTAAVMGPGTGLGIGGLLGRSGRVYPVSGEGGHVGFAPESPAQHKVLQQLRLEYDRVSNERVLSGPGLESTSANRS